MTPTQKFIIGHPQTDPVDDLETCKGAIRAAAWWKRSGMEEHWPLTTDEAVQLLADAGKFDIDGENLVDLVERGLLGKPAVDEAGVYEWSAADVVQAGGLLESREQWRATPSGHDPKKHQCQIILELARAAGTVSQIVTAGPGPRYDVRHLLAVLAQCDSREGRAKLLALLRAVLEVEHGVIV